MGDDCVNINISENIPKMIIIGMSHHNLFAHKKEINSPKTPPLAFNLFTNLTIFFS